MEDEETKLITNRMGRQYHIYAKDTFYEQRFANAGPYQMRNLIFLREMCPDAHTIIDVGMNIANNRMEYSTWAKRVIGFEPYKQTFEMANKNIEHNKNRKVKGRYIYEDGKDVVNDPTRPDGWWKVDGKFASLDMTGEIKTYNVALGEKNVKTKMIHHPNNAGHNCVNVEGKEPKKDRVDIEMKTLDSFEFENVSAIKIDVEGYEKFIVIGAKETIIKWRPIVQVEVVKENYKKFGYMPQDLMDYFFKTFKDYVFCDYQKNVMGTEWDKRKGVMDYFFVPKEKLKKKQKDLSDFKLGV